MLQYHFHICISTAAGTILTPQITTPLRHCVQQQTVPGPAEPRRLFHSCTVSRHEHGPHPLLIFSRAAGLTAFPWGWGGTEPVPAPLPIQPRLVEQGCRVIHLSDGFVHRRKAVCHTRHALKVLAVTLPALITAWWRLKDTFTNLHPLHSHFAKGWLTILYQTRALAQLTCKKKIPSLSLSSFLSVIWLIWQFILKYQEYVIHIFPGKVFCSEGWH